MIAGALDDAGIGSAGLELDQVAGEVIRRDVFTALSAMGIKFDDGCGWSLLPTGGVSMIFDVKLERDVPVVIMFVAGWKPS